jgi:hypothetical protein
VTNGRTFEETQGSFPFDFLFSKEGEKMKSKIIAVDFDGTLCSNCYPHIGFPNHMVINYLRAQKRHGAKLILWTCRSGELLESAVSWCKYHELTFDAVNENLPEIIEAFGSDTRKIFANEYIDDLASNKFELPYEKR